MNVPSNSCLFWRAAFCSFCLGSLGASSGSLWQQTNAHARHNSTTNNPARNVNIDDRRKHHHFRTLRQSSSSLNSPVDAVVASSSDEAIPRGREASSQARHARAAMRAPARLDRARLSDGAPPRPASAVDGTRSIRAGAKRTALPT
ncbi:unnamed protein product [Arctia plantaginis]|uniref:Secreted protein n=1 Tax=Arctia plantaginis TaxID=874455 RepID=A0A8S0Z280_ARCPL|nr:unnamed protein product [Arctia plantaginis]CAB3239170.1 unnamed protein product [Arctia plantaginis]